MNQIVLAIIVANVLFSFKGFNDYAFFEKFKFQIGRIQNGEKIRMFTSAFLHADYMHLGFNMYALYLFGGIVVWKLGVSNFCVIYFGSLFTGSLVAFLYNRNNAYYSAVGASGAVSGILYSAILLYPNMPLMLFPIPFSVPGYVFGIGYLLYSIYGMKKQLGNIGHSAHLGGTIGGFALTLVLYPRIFLENMLLVLGLAIPIVLLLIFEKRLRS